MVDECIKDADNDDMHGVAVVTRKGTWMAGFIASGEITFYSQAPMDCVWYGCNMRVRKKDEHVTVKELTDLCKVFLVSILEVCT